MTTLSLPLALARRGRALRRLSAMLPVAFLLACHGTTEPTNRNDLEGSWFSEPPPASGGSVPETRHQYLSLMVDGTVVSGTGYWGSGGDPRNTIVVSGTVHGTAVELDLELRSTNPSFAPLPLLHFSGALSTPHQLDGTLSGDGSVGSQGYGKPLPID